MSKNGMFYPFDSWDDKINRIATKHIEILKVY